MRWWLAAAMLFAGVGCEPGAGLLVVSLRSDLIAAIAAYAAPGMDRGRARVKLGWIPDPASLP